MQPRATIESQPKELARFHQFIERGAYRDACLMLLDYTINKSTFDELTGDARQAVRLFVETKEAELKTEIMVRTVTRLPNLRGHARATYQLRHFDLMGDFRRAMQVLEEFQLSASGHDVTPELTAWAELQVKDPAKRELMFKHFDLSTEDMH